MLIELEKTFIQSKKTPKDFLCGTGKLKTKTFGNCKISSRVVWQISKLGPQRQNFVSVDSLIMSKKPHLLSS